QKRHNGFPRRLLGIGRLDYLAAVRQLRGDRRYTYRKPFLAHAGSASNSLFVRLIGSAKTWTATWWCNSLVIVHSRRLQLTTHRDIHKDFHVSSGKLQAA